MAQSVAGPVPVAFSSRRRLVPPLVGTHPGGGGGVGERRAAHEVRGEPPDRAGEKLAEEDAEPVAAGITSDRVPNCLRHRQRE